MSKQPSRADRFNEAQSLVSDAKGRAEELRDELQNWLDNLPDDLQTAIDELETFISGCEEAEGVDVSFPRMFS